MKHLFSAGFILFYMKDDQPLFLLLHYPHGHWDLPKGKIEKGETKKEAALRELKEETGLNAEIIEGFEEKFSYFFKQEGELIKKTVYYFIARSSSDKITISFEHIGFAWLSYKQALERLTFDNAKDLLEKAEKFLLKLPEVAQ